MNDDVLDDGLPFRLDTETSVADEPASGKYTVVDPPVGAVVSSLQRSG